MHFVLLPVFVNFCQWKTQLECGQPNSSSIGSCYSPSGIHWPFPLRNSPATPASTTTYNIQSANTANFTSWSCTSILSCPCVPNIPVRYLPVHLTTERTTYLDSSIWPLAFSTTIMLAPETEGERQNHLPPPWPQTLQWCVGPLKQL